MIRLAPALLLAAAAAVSAAPPWVAPGPDGRLVYGTTPRGDRILDFSYAGYGGGGVAPPTVAAVERVSPSGSDDTAAIQGAIDRVGRRPLVQGFRGAVELTPGTFHVTAPLRLSESGVVLRGSGRDATTLAVGGRPHVTVEIGGSGRGRRDASGPQAVGEPVRITDAYVPSATRVVTLADASGFQPGDPVLVIHPITDAWVRFMGMNGLVRNGRDEHWVRGEIRLERHVRAVDGRRVTLDVPLPDDLDARFLGREGAQLAHERFEGRPAHIGVEDLRIVAPPRSVTFGTPLFSAVSFSAVEDVWARRLAVQDTMDSFQVRPWARRVTIEAVDIRHTASIVGAALPTDFALSGSETLVMGCHGKGDRLFYVATEAEACGPNVILRCEFEGNGSIMPHQRWATGLLVDECVVPDGGIELINRGHMGSGHGWTMGWGVIWNCAAATIVVQNPPGAMNWAIGTKGQYLQRAMPFDRSPLIPEGTVESRGRPVVPTSLYLAQLRDRR